MWLGREIWWDFNTEGTEEEVKLEEKERNEGNVCATYRIRDWGKDELKSFAQALWVTRITG